jgi:amidase
MAVSVFTVLQPKPVPLGTEAFEGKRAALLQEFQDRVPTEYYVPRDLIDNAGLDVSGIPAKCGILSPEELSITEDYDAVSLAEAIASRKLTAVAVAKAFSKRAIIAHQLTCCLTQWFMDEAVEQAQKLDAHLAAHGKTVGPLHGVPISIKDHMGIAGTFASAACLSSIRQTKEDVHLIRILRELGAVFYCKTNQPQSLMHLESDSLWGRVLNPYNINLSAGGSTGGEAALIAMKGSVMGIGSDIGGSIRGPSAFCGIYGFKPTSYTLPFDKMLLSPFPGELNILCAVGPMCRSIRDMDLLVKSVLATQPHLEDPKLVPIPWTGIQTPVQRVLKIGLIDNDGLVEPQPPIKRAIAWARKVLSEPKYAGVVEVKPFKPWGAPEALHKIRRMYFPDGGAGVLNAIVSTGEPIHPLTEYTLRDAAEDGMRTAVDVSNQRADRDEFRIAFAKSWQEQDVDVVLGPAFVGPASAHDTAYTWTYTSLYNFVDYPGVVFPTPIVTEADEKYDENYKPLSKECEQVHQLWTETNFKGAPINLQLVARKYHDNDLFGALQTLKDILELS